MLRAIHNRRGREGKKVAYLTPLLDYNVLNSYAVEIVPARMSILSKLGLHYIGDSDYGLLNLRGPLPKSGILY